MRTVDRKYSFWLAGYYDDFIGARTLPDDSNAVGADYLSSKSHHGNPINGLAPLNPRYNYAWVERGDASGGRFSGATTVAASSNGDQYLHNQGIAEWLSYDENRRGAKNWEGRAQLQYPDSLTNANRQIYNGTWNASLSKWTTNYATADAAEGIMWFCNGYDTSGKYWIPTGNTDSTGGRGARQPFVGSGSIGYDAGADAGAGFTTGHLGDFIQYCHLTGQYMGESIITTTTTEPKSILTPIYSPAKKPFLCVQSNRNLNPLSQKIPDPSGKPAVIYDGNLNSIGDYDVFSIRFCVQSFTKGGDESDWALTIKIGFGTNSVTIGSNAAASDYGVPDYGTPKVTHVVDSSGTGFKSGFSPTPAFFDWLGGVAQTATTVDDWWQDLDFVMNYTAGTCAIYHNGTLVSTTTGLSFTAADMVGFQLDLGPLASTDANWQGVLLLDRAAMCFPLTDHPDQTNIPDNEVAMTNMKWDSGVNKASTLNLTVADDKNVYSSKVKDIIQASTYSYSSLLVFRDNIDHSNCARPIWRGTVTNVSQTQGTGGKTGSSGTIKHSNVLKINATDYSSLLDHQIPNWEIGQGGDADSTQTISFMRGETQNKLDMYYFGVEKLQASNANLGFDFSDGAYIPYVDSRMRRNSAHPIQVYNNENTLGPNDTEDSWVSQTVTAAYRDGSNKPVMFTPYATTGSSINVKFEDSNLVAAGDHAITSDTLAFGNQNPLPVIVFDSATALSTENATLVDGVGNVNPYTVSTTLASSSVNAPISKDITVSGGGTIYEEQDGATEIKVVIDTSTAHGLRVGQIVEFDDVFSGSADAGYSNLGVYPLNENGEEFPIDFDPTESNLSSDAAVGATTLDLTNAAQFPTNGTARLYVTSINTSSFWYIDISWTGKISNQLIGVTGVTQQHLAGSRIVVLSAKWSGLNNVPVAVQRVLTATRFRVSYKYDGLSSKLGSFGPIPHGGGGSSPIVSGRFFMNDKVAAVDVSNFPESGSITGYDGTNDFDYAGIDRENNLFTGVSGFSGTLSPGATLTYGVSNTPTEQTELTITGTSLGLSKNDYIGLDETNGMDGLWRIVEEPDDSGGVNTTIRIGLDYAGGHDGTANGKARWSDSSVRLAGNWNQNYRAIHARWIRDIVASKWTQHMFGRIEKDDAGTADLQADYAIGGSEIRVDSVWPYAALKDGGSFEIIDADGNIDAGLCTSASGVTDISISRGYEKDITATVFGRTVKVGSRVSFFITGVTLSNGDKITIRGSSIEDYNGPFIVDGVKNAGLVSQQFTIRKHDTNYPVFWKGSGTGSSTLSVLSGSYLTLTLPTNNMLSRAHSTGATLKVRSFKDDYKHLWVLWSDMRNTEKADADGGKKKSDFGLLYPNNQNYGLTLQWAEQDINAYNGRDAFTDLKIGEDVEIWAMDALVEPATGGLWSDLGSNSETNTIFHNWENKAGTFVIIDTSKFFNLNTESNRGRTGQLSGGTKELGDFLIETEGFPVMIDNYWSQAPATANTADGGIVRYHPNAQNFISDPSLVRSDIADGDKWIQLEDVSKFATQGQGKIVSQKEDKVWFYWWTAKGINLTISALSTTGTDFTTEITTSANHELTADMEVTVTCTSSTPNVSLTTRIDEVTAADKFTIKVPAQITGAGTDGSVVDTNSLYVGERSVIFVGRESDGTGNWNGFSYNSTDITNTDSSKTAEQLLIDAGNAGGVSGIGTLRVTPNENNENPDYTDLTAYNSLSNIFPMRLLMQLEGFVKSPNSGTFYEHDKVRVAWNDSMLKVWLGQAVLTAPYDIHTVPISNNMNTAQKTIVAAGRGGYVTAYSSESAGTPSEITSASHGLTNGDKVSISGTTVVDGTNLTVANVTTNTFTVGIENTGSAGSTVGGVWWKVSEFDDFGSINDARSSTIMGLVASSRDGSGTGDTNGETVTYSWLIGRDGHICYRPTYGSGFSFVANDATPANNNLIVSDMNAQSMNQITNVRVIYSGGASFVDYPSATLGTRARWKIIDLPNVSNQAEAETVAKQEYNKQKQAPLSLKAKVQRLDNSDPFDGEGDTLLDNARYGYIADPCRRSVGGAGTFWTAQLGGCMFPGMVSALNGPQTGAADTGSGTRAWSDWYYWYGANSVAYAVQIVDIPRGMPKTSEATPTTNWIVDTLRIAIAPDDSANATLTADDNPRFKIWLADFEFNNAASTHSPDRVAARLSKSSIVVQGNGIYEIDIPSTYWPSAGTAKIRISVNYDYLLALLRYRCGDTTASNFFRPAHQVSSLQSYSAYNTNSIFPLGMREYSELGAYGEERSEWYAPRILITDDVNFVPATTIDYTDSFLGLTNEPMVITNMSYSVSGANVENLVFSLERDAARQAVGFNTMFQPQNRKSQLTAGLSRGRATEEPNGPWSPDWIGSSVGGGSGGGRGHGPALGGAFTGSGGWGGDTNPNTNMSSQFSPLQNPTPSGPDSPGAATSSSPGITSGAISSGFNSKVKGKMDLNIDAQVGGNFSILGQNKAGAAPSTTSGISAEIPFSPSGGSATVGDNGLIFPGTVGETTNYPQHSFTASIPVPNNVKSKFVAISANANLVGDSTNVGVLTTTVSLSGFERTTTTTVKAGNNGRINLFSGIVDGADVAGGKLQITISRTPDDGTDTAKYSSIAVSNVQVGINRQSVQGTTMSDQMTFSGN